MALPERFTSDEPTQSTDVEQRENEIEVIVEETELAKYIKPVVEWVSLGEFKITHYCIENYHHICNDGSSETTVTGERPIPYKTIAVDPKVIPYGSVVMIDGVEYTANDTGGAINGNRIDICVEKHQEALNLGVKCVEVFIKKTN